MASKKIFYTENSVQIGQQEFSRDELYRLFITENLHTREMMEKLNVSRSGVQRILTHFNIQKTKKQAAFNVKKTLKARYGVEVYTQAKDYKEKLRATSLKKYGVEHPSQSPIVREKFKQTCLLKYGVTTSAIAPEVIKKKQQTCLHKYGAINVTQSPGYSLRLQEKWLRLYGFSNFRRGNWTDIGKQILNDKESFQEFLLDCPTGKYYSTELPKIFGCNLTTIDRIIRDWGLQDFVVQKSTTSQLEKDVSSYISSLGVQWIKKRKFLDHYDIDIYIESNKIGIEFNGTYWHSSAQKEKQYHFKKSRLAEEKGIRLIHIYEYEWINPVKRPIIESMLKIALGKAERKIYARQCEIKKISNLEAKPFNEKNHLQGHRNAQITYGLFYKNELVQLMSFSKTRYNRNLQNEDSWEIIRGCPGSNNVIVGGVSKLFKYFIKENNPKKIFSYCDFNKFDGTGYEAIGMNFIGYTGPDMKWVLPGYQEVVDRQPSKHKELKELAVAQIWGAGSKKYEWIK